MAPHPLFKQSSITPLPLPLHFSFTQNNMLHPTKQLPKSYLNFSDHFNDSCSTTYDHAVNQDSKVQKPAQNNANYRFKAEKTFMVDDDDETGISSRPLWKTSPQHEKNINYRCLSPSSRVEAIARGQKELMEMVSKMPESCYELTLKDLVEHQPVVVVETEEESFAEGRVSSSIDEPNKYKKEKQNNNQKPQIKRSGSVDNGGFLLKMVFPVSLGSKEKKKMKPRKNDCNTSNNSKVSPKPTVTEHTSANSKTVDKDWWKKRTRSSESDGTGSTTNSQTDGTGSTTNSQTDGTGSTINRGSTKTSRSSSRSSGSYRSISSTSRRHRRNSFLAFILCRKNKASR